MVSAASSPPLQKAQGRGTHSFETGNEKPTSKARATRPLSSAFFSRRIVGRNSKAGIIIHELSHILFGTLDLDEDQPVFTLPTDLKIKTADSYEYYAEDSYKIKHQGSQP